MVLEKENIDQYRDQDKNIGKDTGKDITKEIIKDTGRDIGKGIKKDNKDINKDINKDVKKGNRDIKKDPKKEQQSIIKNFIGKDIVITLRGGEKMKGKLETVAQYELMVSISYTPVIIMKHAVDYISLEDK